MLNRNVLTQSSCKSDSLCLIVERQTRSRHYPSQVIVRISGQRLDLEAARLLAITSSEVRSSPVPADSDTLAGLLCSRELQLASVADPSSSSSFECGRPSSPVEGQRSASAAPVSRGEQQAPPSSSYLLSAGRSGDRIWSGS